MENSFKNHVWITFIGTVLLLVGIYAGLKTTINLKVFDKYPLNGVLSFNFTGVQPSTTQEKDCFYTPLYYTADNKTTRLATKEEKDQEKNQQENCVAGVKDARENSKVNDISQSLLFLFLGTGLLISKKIFIH